MPVGFAYLSKSEFGEHSLKQMFYLVQVTEVGRWATVGLNDPLDSAGAGR